jgi:predicted PurR-regulated permease PerM
MALLAVMLQLCWRILAPFLSILLWASVLVLVYYPANQWLRVKLKGRDGLAAFASTMLVLATIILPLVGVTGAVVGEMQATAGHAQVLLTEGLKDPRLPELLDRVYTYTGMNEQELRAAVQNSAKSSSEWLVQSTVSVLGSAMGFLMNMGFVSFTMFYLFLDGDKAVRVLREWLPLDPKDSHALVHRCGEIISASVYGVVVLAAIQGTLGGLMFWWLGLPSPLLWGLVMILMATIPMLGTFVVWVPAAIYLAVTGHLIKAAILTFWGAVVIGMADNLLRPRLVGEKTKMHDLLIFFAVLGGLQAFGVLGILMGPVVLAVAITLLETFRRGDRYQRPAPVEATDPSKDLY